MDRDSAEIAKPLTPAWQDPEQEQFWWSRPEGHRLSVKLSQGATEAIWKMVKMVKYGLVPLTFEGEIFGNGAALDMDGAFQICREYRVFVYNLRQRHAWRLSWNQHRKLEDRSVTNFVFEPVEVLGYKGISDQWTDRPRTKLFANDF